MRLSYNDMTIDVHFSPSANDLTKDDIVTTAVSLRGPLSFAVDSIGPVDFDF